MWSDAVKQAPSRDVVADVLRRRIVLGTFTPGERLPSERVLATQLGVGRSTLRAAITLLREEGLLQTALGRSGGTIVLDGGGRSSVSRRNRDAYARDIDDNFQFRSAIEPLSARLAAQLAGPAERETIAAIARQEASSIGTFRALDSRFHLAIAAAARNPLLLMAVEQSRADFFRWADAVWSPSNWGRLAVDQRGFSPHHVPLADAIAAADGEAAEQRMREHLDEGRLMFLDVLNEAYGARPMPSGGSVPPERAPARQMSHS